MHGGLRNQTEYCVLCHNPSNTRLRRASDRHSCRGQGAARRKASTSTCWFTGSTTARICRRQSALSWWSASAAATTISATYAVPGDEPDRQRRRPANCSLCHVNGSEQRSALIGLNPVTDPQGPINPIQPVASACTGCHVDIPTASHALSNTTSLGEACYGLPRSGAEFAVDKVHAQ